MSLQDYIDADWPTFNDNVNGFGVTGLLNGSVSVEGNLFVEYVEIPGDGITAGLSVSNLRLLYREADMAPVQGDSFVIDAISYRVEDVQTSFDGEAALLLSKPDGVF